MPDRTEAVLRWLDASLDAVMANPIANGLKVKADLEKHKEIVKEAVKDALLLEFQPYAELIEKALKL